MNFLGFTITRSSSVPNRNSKIAIQKSFDPVWADGGPPADPPAPSLSNAYHQVVWVYRAINALAEQVANVPFLLSAGPRGRENLITSGPIVDFYNRPHPHINRFQYWELRVLWLMLRGECIRIPIYESPSPSSSPGPGQTVAGDDDRFSDRGSHYLSPSDGERAGVRGAPSPIPNQKSKLKTILILDPARFTHIVQDNKLQGWRYTGFGPDTPLESQVFLPEEVWFEKLPDPFDFWRGLPPLLVADLAAKTDYSAAAFMRGFLENNADNGLIVRTNEQLEDDQREQILAALRNRKRRAGIADGPLLLWSSAEVVKPDLSSADLQFLENRKFSRSEICAAFGVPEEIVTTTDHNKYDVMQGARLNFIENRVLPLCARLEADENLTTIPALLGRTGSARPGSPVQNQNSKIKNVTGWFDIDSLPIMQQARRDRLAAAKTGFDMGVPFNELNRIFDLGFKPLPWGDIGYLPSKYQPLSAPADPARPGESKKGQIQNQPSPVLPPAEPHGNALAAASVPVPAPAPAPNPHPAPAPSPITPEMMRLSRQLRDMLRALKAV